MAIDPRLPSALPSVVHCVGDQFVMTEVNTDRGATHKIHDSANDVGMSIDAGRLAPGQTSTLKYGFSSESKPSYVNFDFKMFLGDDTAEFTYEW